MWRASECETEGGENLHLMRKKNLHEKVKIPQKHEDQQDVPSYSRGG